LLRDYPVVAILGARQVGKTTLARELAQSHRGPVTTFDLEDPTALARLRIRGSYPLKAQGPWQDELPSTSSRACP
jgi:hypothetical protein